MYEIMGKTTDAIIGSQKAFHCKEERHIAPLRHEATRGTLRGVLIMKIAFV